MIELQLVPFPSNHDVGTHCTGPLPTTDRRRAFFFEGEA